MVCQDWSGQGWRTALEGFGKSCQLVTGPGNETVSFPGPLNLQSCHLPGSLAFILHLPVPALLPAGPTATPTAVPLHLEPGGSVGTAPQGLELTAVFLAFSERSAVLKFPDKPTLGGIDTEGQWLGRK